MEELREAQLAGREPELPARFGAEAGRVESEMATEGSYPGHAAWVDGNWKLHRIEGDGERVRWELYDLEKDPGERRDLVEENREIAARLRRDLEAWLGSVAASHNGADYERL